MIPKLLGAGLIIAACGGIGMAKAMAYRRQERMLQQLISALQAMSSELQYRLTPLPQLMGLGAKQCTGLLTRLFLDAAGHMDDTSEPDAAGCLDLALQNAPDLPDSLKDKLLLLGKSLGRFDLQGQLSGMEAVLQLCKRELDGLYLNRDVRLRSYTTLGLCGGAALVILFI
jgi:stage III sporulation protein AB